MQLIQDIKLRSYLKETTANLLKLIIQSENNIAENKVTAQDIMFKNLEQKLFS